MRRLSTYGVDATFTTETVDVDEATDWNDETVTEETATAPVFVRDQVAAAERDQRERSVVQDVTVYVHDGDLPDGFTIREPGDQPPTTIETPTHTYLVVSDRLRSDNTHEIQVERD